MMKKRALNWFLIILAVCASFIIIIDVGAADDSVDLSGSIIIDCGASKDYQDSETGFWYQTDENFVETGVSITMPNKSESLKDPFFGHQLQTLRCFPEGERNCYTLKPKRSNSNKYLIRTLFSYNGKNQMQSFDLYLGVNRMDTIEYSGYYELAEYIHSPSLTSDGDSDSIQVCLVRTGQTDPCIALLELRPLSTSIYNPIMFSSASPQGPQPLLDFWARIDVGFLSNGINPTFSRYKDDIYDRIWRYDDIDDDSWVPLEWDDGNYDATNTSDLYRLPVDVLSTASQSRNVSLPLNFDLNSTYGSLARKNSEYQVYFHFAEIKKLPVGKKRVIDRIAVNSDYKIFSEPLVLEYLKPVTIVARVSNADNVNFSIIASPKSDAPPILNAFEIYELINQYDSPTDPTDVGAMMNIKDAYKISKLSWQGDPCLPVKFKWEGLSCTNDTNPRITSLNLRSSNLKGVINSSFSNLTELKFLDLSHNELEGPIPEFFAELPELEVLNLTGNKLSGSIPKALKQKTTLQLSVDDNPNLCITTDSCHKKKKSFIVPLVISLSSFSLIIIILISLFIFKRRQKVKAYTNFKKGKGQLESNPQREFSYSEILNICGNFKTLIGVGGFGEVYLGILQDHHVQVAVKLLSSTSVQGFREFRSEVQLLSFVRHRNLVSLLGYCDEGEIKALIYEYMPHGNLLQHLSSEKNTDVLNWRERLIIAIDLATGLDYLHNGCNPPIVHRDLKTSNILLDNSKHAKISDFGLSRAFANDIDSHISTRPAGTPGYIDPQFHRTGNSNKKSDVYSIGIILLELITGKPALARTDNKEVIHIIQCVAPLVERGDIESIVDPRVHGKFNSSSAWRIVEIALSCVSSVAAERPDISQILVELKECLSLEMDSTVPGISIPLEITEFPPSPR